MYESDIIRAKFLTDSLFAARYLFKERFGRKFVVGDHHKLIAEQLDKVFSGEIKRLMILMPPRYSKCVHEETPILTTNGIKLAKEINAGDCVYGYDNGNLVIEECKGTEKAVKESYKITMRSGRTIICSYDHPLLSTFGYVEAQNLKINDRLKVVNTNIDSDYEINDDELVFTTLMIFEGDCGRNMRFSNTDKPILNLFFSTCNNLGIGVKQYESTKIADYCIMGGESGVATNILKKYGIKGHRCYTKRLPKDWFNLSLRQKLIFVDIMFATDGYIAKQSGQSGIALANEGLINDIQMILSSVGIISTKLYKKNDKAGAWCLSISRAETIRLTDMITFYQKRDAALSVLSKKPCFITDTFPFEIVTHEHLTKKLRDKGLRCEKTKDISREKFIRMSDAYPQLKKYIDKDFYYDKVVAIENVGMQNLTHLEVNRIKNFIANGIVSHNTEIAVKTAIAKGLAINPASKFIHTSY